ncbi:MAG: hypothetical protein NW201_06180 [Gemmatimonadales bacterium]|nr:hypothetical protein [Gemmatimonadales bacterium]
MAALWTVLLAGCGGGTALPVEPVQPGPPAPSPVRTELVVYPATASLSTGSSIQLTAFLKTGRDSAPAANVVWSATGGNDVTNGLFRAGATPGLFLVVASVSVPPSQLADTARITITAGPGQNDVPLAPLTQVVAGITAPALPRAQVTTRFVAPAGPVLSVGSATELASALSGATCGSTIQLAAGAVYAGNFRFITKCPGTNPIVLTTAGTIPREGVRVAPERATGFGKLQGVNGTPVLSILPGSGGLRVMGVEFTYPNNITTAFSIVSVGDGPRGQPTVESAPTDIILDRVYVHGHPLLNFQRCVFLNGARAAIVDSYLSECHGRGFDSQGVLATNTPGPIRIENNYIAGAGMGIMFGGADAARAEMIPQDIVVRRNYITKPPEWRGRWSVKNVFELKAAVRILVEANIMENSWVDGQTGSAVLMTSSNQDGNAPFTAVADVVFRYNLVRNAVNGIAIFSNVRFNPTLNTQRVLVQHNLLSRIGSFNSTTINANFGFQTAAAVDEIVIANNTVTGTDSLAIGFFLVPPPAGPSVIRLQLQDNLIQRGRLGGVLGDGGAEGNASLASRFVTTLTSRGNVYFGGPTPPRAIPYPAGDVVIPTSGEIGFVNFPQADFRLAADSRFRALGQGNGIVGADVETLARAISGVPTGNWGP